MDNNFTALNGLAAVIVGHDLAVEAVARRETKDLIYEGETAPTGKTSQRRSRAKVPP